MPGRARVPVFVRRCVRAVGAQYGDMSRAFAICVGQAQKSGYLKPGSMEPTSKGKTLSKKKSREDGAGEKSSEYERMLAAAREESKHYSTTLSDYSTTASLRVLCGLGWMLLEQGEEEEEAPVEGDAAEDTPDEEDPLAALDGEVSGDLKIKVAMQVGEASEETRRAVLKLFKHYQVDLHGGLEGTSGWTTTTLRVRYHSKDSSIEFELWVRLLDYVGTRVLTDLVQQLASAALELSRSMIPSDARQMLGHVTPDKIAAEPVEFVQAG